MLTGHASHQVGLDADIWLTPMPDARADARRSARRCRRPMWCAPTGTTSIRRSGRPAHVAIIKAAARETRRSSASSSMRRSRRRSAATPAATAPGSQGAARCGGTTITSTSAWAVRAASRDCEPQAPVPPGDGCGKELDWWFRDAIIKQPPAPKPKPGRQAEAEARGMTMADLPPACRQVLLAP